ncbi:IS3 family transposase [Hymenobacter sp.]|jgi:transposase InsO family protein|uniref:IS3 family transposase n=1 Tax=Hymenobacter sp. TaxID=1898978 RepID=UPI002ED7CCC2
MRQKYPRVGVGALCGLFGKTRNAYYDHQRRATAQALLDGLVLELVAGFRKEMPRVGTRKLHFLLQPHLGEHAPQVGRDYLFALLAAHGQLIRRRKRRVVTTQTCLPLLRRPNLIEHLAVGRAEQVWVSDITYVRLLSGWSYLSLITDLYSHKIVGACLHPDLSVRGTLAALHQALATRTHPQRPLIHHSDRGLQYAAREYVGLLESHGVCLSMTEHGDPYENAVAERVNGILKDEFGLGDTLPGFAQAEDLVVGSVRAYNDLRPHGSCNFLTPSQAHDQEGPLVRRWKNYYQPAPLVSTS